MISALIYNKRTVTGHLCRVDGQAEPVLEAKYISTRLTLRVIKCQDFLVDVGSYLILKQTVEQYKLLLLVKKQQKIIIEWDRVQFLNCCWLINTA